MIFVLGRSGQLARELARVQTGHELETAGREQVDFLQPDTIADAIRSRLPRAVIYAAGYAAVDRPETEGAEAEVVNATSPSAATMACAELGIHPEVGVVADQHGAPTHAWDLAAACLGLVDRLLVGDHSAKGMFHYAGQGDAVRADVAEETFRVSLELWGPSTSVKRIATVDYPTPARRPANSRFVMGRIGGFGIQTFPWRDRVRDCVAS